MPDSPPARRRSRTRRILLWFGVSIGSLVIAAIIGILISSQVGVMAAEPEPLAQVHSNAAIEITDTDGAIVMHPTSGASEEGLVFIPGAKVDPWSYAAKLSGVVESGATVVITKPWLNLAFFDLRPLETFTDLAPDVSVWAVGGHSLGGVRACQLTDSADGLILFASYCANEVSDSGVPVLSLAGTEDGLSTPEKIADARPLLPADANMVEIAGAAHSSFGDYGTQAGDGIPTISDDEMTAVLTTEIDAFLSTTATQ